MSEGGDSDDGGDRGVVIRAMLIHAAGAGFFFFVFQRYGMKESVEISLAWAAFFAAAAAMLAWKQTAR